MKKNNIYLPLFLLGLLISAYSKSEFDPKVDGFLTEERKKELMKGVETKANLLQVELNGIYNNNIRSQSNSGETFGLKAIHLATDLSEQNPYRENERAGCKSIPRKYRMERYR